MWVTNDAHTHTNSTALLGGVRSREGILLDVLITLLQTLLWCTINFNRDLNVFCCIFWWKCTLVWYVHIGGRAFWCTMNNCTYIGGRVFWCTHILVEEYEASPYVCCHGQSRRNDASHTRRGTSETQENFLFVCCCPFAYNEQLLEEGYLNI